MLIRSLRLMKTRLCKSRKLRGSQISIFLQFFFKNGITASPILYIFVVFTSVAEKPRCVQAFCHSADACINYLQALGYTVRPNSIAASQIELTMMTDAKRIGFVNQHVFAHSLTDLAMFKLQLMMSATVHDGVFAARCCYILNSVSKLIRYLFQSWPTTIFPIPRRIPADDEKNPTYKVPVSLYHRPLSKFGRVGAKPQKIKYNSKRGEAKRFALTKLNHNTYRWVYQEGYMIYQVPEEENSMEMVD